MAIDFSEWTKVDNPLVCHPIYATFQAPDNTKNQGLFAIIHKRTLKCLCLVDGATKETRKTNASMILTGLCALNETFMFDGEELVAHHPLDLGGNEIVGHHSLEEAVYRVTHQA